MPDFISLPGCRHDILGHYLKAIGLLRVLPRCAAPGHRDAEAEGWWDLELRFIETEKEPRPDGRGSYFI